MIAYRVFEQFNTETTIRLSATGAKQVQGENAIQQTPKYLIATANQRFINQYQGEYLHDPIIEGNFVDWFGCNDSIEKSMYGYLVAGAVGKVFFITCGCDDVVCEDVSEDYLESN